VQQLVNETKVYAIVSPAGSQAIPGTYDFIKSSRTPMWGPVSPPDPKIEPVFILGPSRTEQLRVAIDYLGSKGVTKLAVIGQNNTLGAEAKAAAETQAPKNNMTIVAQETVEVQSKDVTAAVNKVLASGADGVVMGVDNAQAALVQNQINQAGKRGQILIATDAGAGGPGGENTTKLCEPNACEGFIAGMQTQLTTSDAVASVRDLVTKNNMETGGLNFIIQTYAYTKAFFEVLKSMNGDYRYDNFYKTAEAIDYDSGLVPKIKCGPLPDGHSCGAGAALGEFRAGKWTVVQDFTVAK
jgi:branched-chain amino acid transport system substrate-binding protein